MPSAPTPPSPGLPCSRRPLFLFRHHWCLSSSFSFLVHNHNVAHSRSDGFTIGLPPDTRRVVRRRRHNELAIRAHRCREHRFLVPGQRSKTPRTVGQLPNARSFVSRGRHYASGPLPFHEAVDLARLPSPSMLAARPPHPTSLFRYTSEGGRDDRGVPSPRSS